MLTGMSRFARELSVTRSVIKKEYMMWRRYPSRVLFMLLMPFLSILTLYFQGMALVGGTTSDAFAEYAGTSDYLVFIIVGSALYIFVSTAIWGIGNAIRREQMMGTLESVWVTPVSKYTIFFGIALFDGIFSIYIAFMQLLFATIVLPVNLLRPEMAIIVVVTALLLFSLYGLGFLFTGIVLLFKEMEDLTNLINTTLRMVSPVSYPLAAMPAPIAIVATFVPLTYALGAIRGYIGITDAASLWHNAGILVVFDIAFLIVGSIVFTYAERRARRRGEIATH
jgi:ABC-2 type transport system permease protein